MTNNIRKFADPLADIYMRIEDAKVEAAAIIEQAKERGINVKALRKVAKELVMQSDKLAQRYEDEAQIDMFRDQIGIRERKGLDKQAWPVVSMAFKARAAE